MMLLRLIEPIPNLSYQGLLSHITSHSGWFPASWEASESLLAIYANAVTVSENRKRRSHLSAMLLDLDSLKLRGKNK